MTTAQNAITFLGWHRPFPAAVAERLIARWPDMDFDAVSVIVSGGRAGRRILALLADEAQTRRLAMKPPTFRTVGEIPELLYRPPLPVAKTFVQQLAWVSALETTDPDALQKLFPRLRAGADLGSWQGAAAVLDRCKEELATGSIRFDDVLERTRGRNDLGSAERWEAAAAVHAAYLDILRDMGFCDRQEARRLATETSNIHAAGPIVLAGVVDLSHLARSMLEHVADVETLVFAPRELADGFDRFGSLRTEFWSQRQVDLSTVKFRVARTISDQADAAFSAIAELPPPIHTDDVTLGVADESIVPHLETTASNLENVPVRYGPGRPVLQTRPVQLLNVIADYLQSGEFRHFSVLVRHPDIEKYLRAQSSADIGAQRKGARDPAETSDFSFPSPGTPGERQGEGLSPQDGDKHPSPGPSPGVPGEGANRPDARNVTEPAAIGWRDWRTLLDNYAGEFLPLRLGPQCRQIDGWRGQPRSDGKVDDRMYLAWLFGTIEELLGDIRKPDNVTLTPDQWAAPILAMLRRVYGRVWDQSDDRQRQLVLACKELRNGLDEIHAAGEISNRSHFPKIAAHDAIRALIGLCASRRIPPPLTGNEIEIVGWLELMPDDALHLVVTGFNEGFVPESSRAYPLLNETVRQAMGLAGDRERLARDTYLLTAMIRSRPKNAVTLISGRVSAQSDPILPSRLMFACEPKTMARRVLTAIDLPPVGAPLALRFAHADRSAFKVGATIPPGVIAPTEMRVTAFRDYLASPQGFYLKHVLKLQTLEEGAPRELDPGQCGEIVHTVLRNFAATPAAESSSRQQCLDTLLGLLDTQVSTTFGTSLPGALKFQVEMIRKRLQALAEHQASWFKEGWRIVHTEWAPQNSTLSVDNAEMGLRGRIDRIDYHAGSETWAVLDYKVTTGEKTPEKTHQSADGWVDLQLPLYRHLAREIITDQRVQLGYVVISDRADCTRLCMAQWDDAALKDADETARQVVRDVRTCNFHQPGDRPPSDGIFAHIFGEGALKTDTGDETEEESR